MLQRSVTDAWQLVGGSADCQLEEEPWALGKGFIKVFRCLRTHCARIAHSGSVEFTCLFQRESAHCFFAASVPKQAQFEHNHLSFRSVGPVHLPPHRRARSPLKSPINS